MKNDAIFSNTYDTVVSLGSWCILAEQLKINNIYNTEGPFDWIGTPNTVNLIKQFDDNFSRFFMPEDSIFEQNQSESRPTFHITDTSNGFYSLHDISKKNPPDMPLDELWRKFQHKLKSLFTKIEVSNKILFMRVLSFNDDFDTMISLTNCITNRFPDKCINFLFIKRSEEEQSISLAQNAHLLCFETNYNGINDIVRWKGNNKNWKKALANIKTVSRQDAFLANLETFMTSKLIGRKVVIWGMNGLFTDIEQLLMDYKHDDYFAYDKKLSRNHQLSHRILKDTDFLYENKPYVIVNTRRFHEDIFDSLHSNGFEVIKDYYYY